MENENALLRLEKLTNIDIMEIEEELGPSVVKVADPSSGAMDRHGDFGLSAVMIILGAAALNSLAIWLAKKRVRTEDLQHMKVTVSSDRTVTIDVTTIRKSATSASPDAATVQALSGGLRDVIQQAISLAGPGSTS